MPNETGTMNGANGKWDWEITPGDPDQIRITFTPNKTVTCKNIRLAQSVTNIAYDENGNEVPGPPDKWWKNPADYPYGHETKDRVTDADGHTVYIDHLACEGDPYYNGDDKGKDTPSKGDGTTDPPTGTTLTDGPSAPLGNKDPKIKKIVYIYETVAICADTGEILGTFIWKMEATATSTGKITVTSKDKEPATSDTFKKALKKFTENHTKVGPDGKLHWYCPETSDKIKGPNGTFSDPFGGEVPDGYKKLWVAVVTNPVDGTGVADTGVADMGVTNTGVARFTAGGGPRFETPQLAMSACLENPAAAAIKFTWSGDQSKTRSSVVFSAIADLGAGDIAPFVEQQSRFANDFSAINFITVAPTLLRDLVIQMGLMCNALVNSGGVVTVSLIAGLRTYAAAAYTGALDPAQVGQLMIGIAPHPNTNQPALEAFHYVALNMGQVT